MPPAYAYAPGTQLTVGLHRIQIIKYISEGGFAHVYTCNVDPPFQGLLVACLKRVAVPSKWQLNLLRQEVDAMKRLRGNPTIVLYIDLHASRMAGGGSSGTQQYEVFVLMEYCSNNGLIDFMNARLTHKLTEPEILTIMRDITVGVAMCHHLNPPLIHRDIKIENVLIDAHGTYKLCDFGLSVAYAPVPKTASDKAALQADLQQNTTPQYRAPEMIDLSLGFPIDDKLDVWALGVFLYKLCYYTTPFELPQHTSMDDLERAILNSASTLRIPHDVRGLAFLARLKHVIKCCLRDDPRRRPNAVQLLEEICAMKGEKPPNVVPYTVRHHHEPAKQKTAHNPANGDHLSAAKPAQSATTGETAKPHVIEKTPDPFSTIDKSRLLKREVSRDATRSLPRPVSLYEERPSAHALKNFIQQQLNDSSDDLPRRKSDEDNTLEFLRNREEAQSLGLRQSTGGSIKLSFKNGLRKISTGSSSYSQVPAENKPSKRSSISSLKQLLTGSRRDDDRESVRVVSNPEEVPVHKLSIQRRMKLLLNNNDETFQKTALGYGKFTDDQDDIAAINDTGGSISVHASPTPEPIVSKPAKVPKTLIKAQTHMPPKVPIRLSSRENRGVSKKGSFNSSEVPVVPKKEPVVAPKLSVLTNRGPKPPQITKETKAAPKEIRNTSKEIKTVPLKVTGNTALGKRPPPKPKKPVFLKSPSKGGSHERRLSNSSEISLPDIDDLEQQFSKRFPSYV